MDAKVLQFVQQMMMQNPSTVPDEVKEAITSASAPASIAGPSQDAWTDEASEYLQFKV